MCIRDRLGVEPGEQRPEALADLADDVLVGDEKVVDEDLVGVDGVAAVSYTHLDVYKRQHQGGGAVGRVTDDDAVAAGLGVDCLLYTSNTLLKAYSAVAHHYKRNLG